MVPVGVRAVGSTRVHIRSSTWAFQPSRPPQPKSPSSWSADLVAGARLLARVCILTSERRAGPTGAKGYERLGGEGRGSQVVKSSSLETKTPAGPHRLGNTALLKAQTCGGSEEMLPCGRPFFQRPHSKRHVCTALDLAKAFPMHRLEASLRPLRSRPPLCRWET